VTNYRAAHPPIDLLRNGHVEWRHKFIEGDRLRNDESNPSIIESGKK
jgi:hypothetical protein